jgi:hypothetical protein
MYIKEEQFYDNKKLVYCCGEFYDISTPKKYRKYKNHYNKYHRTFEESISNMCNNNGYSKETAEYIQQERTKRKECKRNLINLNYNLIDDSKLLTKVEEKFFFNEKNKDYYLIDLDY